MLCRVYTVFNNCFIPFKDCFVESVDDFYLRIDTSSESGIFCGKYADHRDQVSVEFLLCEELVFERVIAFVIHCCESFGSLTPICFRASGNSHAASDHISKTEKVMSKPTTMNRDIVFLSRTR